MCLTLILSCLYRAWAQYELRLCGVRSQPKAYFGCAANDRDFFTFKFDMCSKDIPGITNNWHNVTTQKSECLKKNYVGPVGVRTSDVRKRGIEF